MKNVQCAFQPEKCQSKKNASDSGYFCLLFVDILHENQNQSHSFQFVKTFHGACKIGAKLLVHVIRLEINNTNYWHQEGRPLNNFFGKVYLRQDLLRLPVLASLLQAPRSRDLKILTCAEYSG